MFSKINWTAWKSNYTDVSSWIRKTEANTLRIWRLLEAITLWWPVLLLGPGRDFSCCTTQEKMRSQEQGKSNAYQPRTWSKWRKEFWSLLSYSTTVNRKLRQENKNLRTKQEAAEVAQLVKCLPYKHQEPTSPELTWKCQAWWCVFVIPAALLKKRWEDSFGSLAS